MEKIIKENIGYKIQKKKERNCYTLRFAGNILGKAFKEWFGHLSHNKKIPDFILRNC